MTPIHVFLVEDEDSLRIPLADDLIDAGYRVQAFADALAAKEAFPAQQPELIITDIKMPGMNGLEFLKYVKSVNAETLVIVITAHGSISSAVEAMKLGAYDYLTKPFDSDQLAMTMGRAVELIQLRASNRFWNEECKRNSGFGEFIGVSEAARSIKEQVRLVAESNSTVLIEGETGTGKELVANMIHFESLRAKKPFVKVSAAVLSREMFESELFGHERGAFTGALKERPGRFELAEGGTLYLDDADDIPLDLQVKLLRVLEEREFERVGGSRTIKTDVRVIASTKVDLKRKVADGAFREDLFYRLNVYPILLTPLRTRVEDIRPLADYWLGHFAFGRKLIVHSEVYELLERYRWRGNVRELRNIMERLSLTATAGVIDVSKLPIEVLAESDSPTATQGPIQLEQILAETEIRMISAMLAKCAGNRAQAAKLLGLPVSTLRTKMEKYSLS